MRAFCATLNQPRAPRGESHPAWPPAAWVVAALLVALLPGCSGQQPKKVLTYRVDSGPEVPARLWPSPPEVPRYRYVGELWGEQNFQLPKKEAGEGGGFWAALGTVWRWITGLDDSSRPPVALQRPQDGATDGEGRIYVTDASRQAVFVFDPVAGLLRLWEFADDQRRFVSPVGVAVDHLERLLVTDAELGGVFRFGKDGSFQGSFGEGVLQRPTGIAFDAASGQVFVADTEANDIKVFQSDGKLVGTVGLTGDSAGQLNRPVYLTFAANHLYVSDALNARIQVFNRAGQATAAIGQRGLYVGNLTRPKGVAVDDEGHVYVVESFYDHLLVFRRNGVLLMGIGGTGRKPGQFYLPAGVWTDSGNRIYVADMFNGRVSVFQFLGAEQ